MPPFIPQKRRSSLSATPSPPARKQNLFRNIDRTRTSGTAQENKDFLNNLGSGSDESSLSDLSGSSDEDFEDVYPAPPGKRPKLEPTEEEQEEEEFDWENAVPPSEPNGAGIESSEHGDFDLTLDKGHQKRSLVDLSGKKKGPSKIERRIRNDTHRMHVQFLLFHNWLRNSWTCNTELQEILVKQLPPNVRKEVDRWRVSSGLQAEVEKESKSSHRGRGRKSKVAKKDTNGRHDWGPDATIKEKGLADMSRGDPIIRLLKVLAAYWRKRFYVTTPALRKQGYKSLQDLEAEISSFKNDGHDPEVHGEHVGSKQDFVALARKCEGSRDVGAQLFLALVRGIGINARLVASLQPTGFGWTKNEEKTPTQKDTHTDITIRDQDDDNMEATDVTPISNNRKAKSSKVKSKPKFGRGAKDAPIDLEEGDGFTYTDAESGDDVSGVDYEPVSPTKRQGKSFDKDLLFPTYWVEAISPVTHQVYPVDPLVLTPAVPTNADMLTAFEPRGAKAEKAKQVLAYVVAYSSDGTAKDVTTRYLKRHVWPGRTKGVRMPVEKIPVYNHRGKIKRYEKYDWFISVISGYGRTHEMRTAVDDLEDAMDLKPVKIEKKEAKENAQDTLQSLKSSADFVLERFLRREEALLPGSTPVRDFTSGKGDKAKTEPVFKRKDVVICRTAESWHKEGRGVKEGEQPMKVVPVRAVTTNRKREIEEAQRDGERLMQGMYSWDQTDWIIPPPIENGVIPKNAYGNMDCFVPSMVPEGAAHIPLRSTMKVCKRLGIDYAEAVTGFEFGNRMAVPVISGVIVAVEHEKLVLEGWAKDEEERKRKEDAKREKVALTAWKKFLMGLRIKERFQDEFGEDVTANSKEEFNPFTNQKKAKAADEVVASRPSSPVNVEAGGFLLEDDEDVNGEKADDEPDGREGFTIENGDNRVAISPEKQLRKASPPTTGQDKEEPSRISVAKTPAAKRKRGRPPKATPKTSPLDPKPKDGNARGRPTRLRISKNVRSPYFASDDHSEDESSLSPAISSDTDRSSSDLIGSKPAKKKRGGRRT